MDIAAVSSRAAPPTWCCPISLARVTHLHYHTHLSLFCRHIPLKLITLARKFGALDTRDQLALFPAVLRLAAVRAMLRVLPFKRVLLWADRPVRGGLAPHPVDARTERRFRAVERVGHRLFPRNPCLTEAVVVQRMLRRSGHPSMLRIGVRKAPGALLEAHAWVEYRGEVVIGSRGLSDEHTPLPPFEVAKTRRPGGGGVPNDVV